MIAEIGEALCGEHWVTGLATALQVNRRTVQRWHDGSEEVPEGVWRDLYERLRQQAVENARLSYAVIGAHPDVLIKCLLSKGKSMSVDETARPNADELASALRDILGTIDRVLFNKPTRADYANIEAAHKLVRRYTAALVPSE